MPSFAPPSQVCRMAVRSKGGARANGCRRDPGTYGVKVPLRVAHEDAPRNDIVDR